MIGNGGGLERRAMEEKKVAVGGLRNSWRVCGSREYLASGQQNSENLVPHSEDSADISL